MDTPPHPPQLHQQGSGADADGPEAQHPASRPNQMSELWCPACAHAVDDPLVCGDCSAVICRVCGTPLESADELAFG